MYRNAPDVQPPSPHPQLHPHPGPLSPFPLSRWAGVCVPPQCRPLAPHLYAASSCGVMSTPNSYDRTCEQRLARPVLAVRYTCMKPKHTRVPAPVRTRTHAHRCTHPLNRAPPPSSPPTTHTHTHTRTHTLSLYTHTHASHHDLRAALLQPAPGRLAQVVAGDKQPGQVAAAVPAPGGGAEAVAVEAVAAKGVMKVEAEGRRGARVAVMPGPCRLLLLNPTPPHPPTHPPIHPPTQKSPTQTRPAPPPHPIPPPPLAHLP